MSQNISHVTDDSFDQEVINAAQPVLVDFWAEWCSPCRMIAPLLEQVATDSQGKIKVAKLNVDEHQKTAAKYNIRSIPTLLIFSKGQVVATKIGVKSMADLVAFVNPHLQVA